MVLASCMQVQNIIGLWNLTAAPPVDDRVSLEAKSAELHACLHEAGHNVFSDCREKLERSSEAGTTMLTVWSHTVAWAKDHTPMITSYFCSWRRQIGEGAQSIAW